MKVKSIFDGIEESDMARMLNCFGARFISYKKDRTIITNIINTKVIGIILKGTADIIRYDYNGNRSIIEKLEENSVFGEVFSRVGSEVSVVATTDCEVVFIDYDHIINRCKKNCSYHAVFANNVLQLLSTKIVDLNDRLEVLSKRTIRDKLLTYFNLLAKNKPNRTFILPFTYTDLADYLSVDRSAMMREIKILKEEGFIEANGKRIIINSF